MLSMSIEALRSPYLHSLKLLAVEQPRKMRVRPWMQSQADESEESAGAAEGADADAAALYMGPHTNLASVGLNSQKVVGLASRLSDHFDLELPVTAALDYPTLGQLSEYVRVRLGRKLRGEVDTDDEEEDNEASEAAAAAETAERASWAASGVPEVTEHEDDGEEEEDDDEEDEEDDVLQEALAVAATAAATAAAEAASTAAAAAAAATAAKADAVAAAAARAAARKEKAAAVKVGWCRVTLA